MSATFERAWALISKGDRDRSLTDGYDDRTGLYCSYDSNVSQSQRIQVGDLAVIREDNYIAGWGIIEQITITPNQPKRMVRCPQCKRNRITRRKTKHPANRCTNCKREFEDSEAIVGIEYVTAFQAWYASTWTEAARPVDYRELEPLQIHNGTFNSMRPLDAVLVVPMLDRISGRDLDLDLEVPPEVRMLLGGMTETVVRRRRGQRALGLDLIRQYGENCAFSGGQPPQVLEAAHLYSYAIRPEHRSDAGLLLRRDYHALFDAKLVTVNPSSLKIEIASVLKKYPNYRSLENAPLRLQGSALPSRALLADHFDQAMRVFAAN